MIRVHTGSRLHLGVFRFGEPSATERYFGGVGLMVRDPGLRLAIEPATDWSAQGPLAERALKVARTFTASFPSILPHRVTIESAAPEHAGLGTGTQLALAVAEALATSARIVHQDIAALARYVNRGQRSALGIHGFAHGGFLVEAGKRASDALAPLVARAHFPDDWRLVLAVPRGGPALHGPEEIAAFRRLGQAGIDLPTDALSRLALLGMLPALAERDIDAFGDALHTFNRTVGEAFAAVQGGPYAGPRVTEIVAYLRGEGVRGVAQSSWGPTVCAVVADPDHAAALASRLRQRFTLSDQEVWITAARNEGAAVTASPKSRRVTGRFP